MVEARRLVAAEAASGAPDALAPVTNIVYMGMGAPCSVCRGLPWLGRRPGAGSQRVGPARGAGANVHWMCLRAMTFHTQ